MPAKTGNRPHPAVAVIGSGRVAKGFLRDLKAFGAPVISNGNGPLVPAAEALQTMRLAFAVEQSIAEYQPVETNQL